MANIGSFILGLPDGTSAGEASAPVEIPVEAGTAAEVVARAADSAWMTVMLVDADTVSILLTVPEGATTTDITAFASDLASTFSTETAPEDDELAIGYFTVTAKGVIGMADSADPDSNPDYVPVVGTVTFFPSFARPIKIVPTNTFFAVTPTGATFDSDGELSYDGGKGVRLISPQWIDLSDNAWTWLAQVRPGPGQTWEGFDVTFTAAPGASIDLVDFL